MIIDKTLKFTETDIACFENWSNVLGENLTKPSGSLQSVQSFKNLENTKELQQQQKK
jgi:hypothetical protein